MTTMDRFHCSDNTLSENAAYQLISSRISGSPSTGLKVLEFGAGPVIAYMISASL